MNQKLMLAPSRTSGGIYGKSASMVNEVYKPIDNAYVPTETQLSTGIYGAGASMVNEAFAPMDNTYVPTAPQTQRKLSLKRSSRFAPSRGIF